LKRVEKGTERGRVVKSKGEKGGIIKRKGDRGRVEKRLRGRMVKRKEGVKQTGW
jgi:hypothetical protein